MAVNIEQLSAKELFELANRKLQLEQEEARRSELTARVVEVKKRQQQAIAEHEQALAALDGELTALRQRRDALVAAHQKNLAALDTELAELARESRAAAAAPAEPPAAEAAPEPVQSPAATKAAPRSESEEEFVAAILDAMKGRTDISDSLLREKLRLKGLPLGNLGKQLEKLVREGLVVSKGGGNYALKKR